MSFCYKSNKMLLVYHQGCHLLEHVTLLNNFLLNLYFEKKIILHFLLITSITKSIEQFIFSHNFFFIFSLFFSIFGHKILKLLKLSFICYNNLITQITYFRMDVTGINLTILLKVKNNYKLTIKAMLSLLPLKKLLSLVELFINKIN